MNHRSAVIATVIPICAGLVLATGPTPAGQSTT
jgi:Tfp pilus assembly pilus retraction ATPase PilT